MARSAGNRKLKAARLARGYGSQQALADALGVGVRQVRRWESGSPPWPHEHHQRLLRRVLGLDIEQLGFMPPWEIDEGAAGHSSASDKGRSSAPRAQSLRSLALNGSGAANPLTAPVADHVAAVTTAYRRMYWSVDPHSLHGAVLEHVRLGETLLSRVTGAEGVALASSIAESGLLVGRIEFFDLRQAEAAAESLTKALQFAGEANDSLLGAAILAHAAFIPGWSSDRTGASDRLAAARAYARRGNAPPLMWAWLDSVDAECATRCGDLKDALALIDRAESHLHKVEDPVAPDWMDWFSTIRLAAFKGNTQLRAGHTRRARDTLTAALVALPSTDTKQRAVMLADLAAVEAAQENVPQACDLLADALDQLSLAWYSMAMERVRDVRRLLHRWQDEPCVRDLDDRIFSWDATLTAVRS